MARPAPADNGGVKRLQKLRSQMQKLGGSSCHITPTLVIYELCRLRDQRLLHTIHEATAHTIRARWKPKVERAVAFAAKDQTVHDSMIRKAWAFGAYTYIEALWKDVALGGVWGRVKQSTIGAKGRALREVREFQAEHRAVRTGRARRPQRSVSTAGSEHIANFGVRSRERERRWYDIQKGKRQVGMRDDRREPTDPVMVYIGNRRIGRRGQLGQAWS